MTVFATSAVAGTFAGSALHRYLPEKTIKLALGLFLAAIATYIIALRVWSSRTPRMTSGKRGVRDA